MISEPLLDLLRLCPLIRITLDRLESMHMIRDFSEDEKHLRSEGILRIRPEEILREVADGESLRFLDHAFVLRISTDDQSEESCFSCSILSDESDTIFFRDLHICFVEEVSGFDMLRES